MGQPAQRLASAGSTDAISSLLAGFSLEATFPKPEEIDTLRRTAPAGTRIYLSCLPDRPPERLVEFSAGVRAAGLEPVPHLTARAFADAAAIERLLSRLATEAGVRSVLAIAGDRDEAAGAFEGALDLIDSGLLEANGIQEIDVSGYPDGHPKIDDKLLASVLPRKLEAAARRNLRVNITSQFSFEPEPILAWLRGLRAAGVSVPVHVGVAGPTSMRSLLRFAMRCGVRTSLRGAMNPKALQLLSVTAPDGIIRAIAEAPDRAELGAVGIHFFSFGGLVPTAEWASTAAGGQIALNAHGFDLLR